MTSAVFPIVNHTDAAEASPGTASTTTLTMTQGSGSASVDLAVQDASGTFAASSDSQMAKFNITTNNYTGYTLTISSDNDDGILSNGSGGNLSSIDSILGASDFDTPTYNNKWGYKPSKYNGVANNAYFPAPTTTATILDKTSSANSTATADNTYSIGLGARADYSMPSGTYTATFILTAMANPVPYSISFTDNSGDATVAGMPKIIIGDADSTEVELPTNIPQRTGFTFAGWCDTTPTVGSDGSSTCPTGGTTYQPSTDSASTYIGIDQTAALNATTLYAMWTAIPVAPTVDVTVNFSGGVSAVSFVASGHNTGLVSTSGGKATLDVGVAYTMTAYMSDAYGFSGWALNSSSYGTLSSTTTNPATFTTNANSSSAVITVTSIVLCTNTFSGGTLQAFNPSNLCASVTSGTLSDSRDNQNYTVAKLADGHWWMTKNLNLAGGTTLTSADSNVTSNYTLPASSTSGFSSDSTAYVYNSGSTTCSSSSPCYSYYSYVAATAGTNPSSGAATSDICPKGWRLPTQAELSTLRNSYTTGATITAAPFLGVYGGSYDSSSFGGGGSNGRYWSSTAGNSSYAYYLYFNSSGAAVNYANKRLGFSVRCVKS